MLILIKHRLQFLARRATISKLIDNLIITINLKFHGENYGLKAGSTHFFKAVKFVPPFFFFSLRSNMIDRQFSWYFTIRQSKVTQITQIKVFEFRINTCHFIWTSLRLFILLPILAILEFKTTRLLRAFKWDPAARYIVLSRMRRFVLLL